MDKLCWETFTRYICGQKLRYICKEHVWQSWVSNNFYNSYFSVMEWAHTSLSQKTLMNCGSFTIFLLKMWPNLLGQKYRHSNANIWLNVPCPFSPQLGAFGSHPQASGKLLADSLTTPLDRIGAVQIHLLVFWNVSVHMFSMGFRSDFSHSFTTFDVCLGSLFCWNTKLCPRPNLLADNFRFSWRILLLHYTVYFL